MTTFGLRIGGLMPLPPFRPAREAERVRSTVRLPEGEAAMHACFDDTQFGFEIA